MFSLKATLFWRHRGEEAGGEEGAGYLLTTPSKKKFGAHTLSMKAEA